MNIYIYCGRADVRSQIVSATNEFKKRLSAYANTDIIWNFDMEDFPLMKSDNALCFEVTYGKSTYDSLMFADFIKNLELSGKSNIYFFVIQKKNCGIKELAEGYGVTYNNFSISASEFPPDALSLMLIEQIYRGFTILQGKTYHK